MESKSRAILRIRCERELFRRFKKLAVDFESYEDALKELLNFYEASPHTEMGSYRP